MTSRKRLTWYIYRVLLVLQCAWLLFFTLRGINQPVYRFGMDLTLTDGVYRIRRVVEEGPAWEMGLRPGMEIVEIQGEETGHLDTLSVQDLEAYLEKSSSLFPPRRFLQITTSQGESLVLKPDSTQFSHRLWMTNRTFLGNSLLALLLLIVAFLFHAALKATGPFSLAIYLFFVFMFFLAPAMQLSFFHTLWARDFLQLRFVLLDIFGTVTAALFLLLALSFPRQRVGHPWRVFLLLLLPLGVKYLLIALKLLTLFGPSSYYIHVYALLMILFSLNVFIFQYTRAGEGERRSLRWVFSGVVATVLPYIFYLTMLISLGSYVGSSWLLRAASMLANGGLLFFPLLLGMGLTGRHPFDIDKVLGWLLLFLIVLAFQVGIYFLFALCFSAISREISGFLTVFTSALVLTALFFWGKDKIQFLINREGVRRQKELERLSHFLSTSHTRQEIHGEVLTVLHHLYTPLGLSFLQRDESGKLLTEAGDDLPPSFELPADGRDGLLFSLSHEEGRASLLYIGPRSDGDIYTKNDISSLTTLSYSITQAFENVLLYEQLFTMIQNLEDENALRKGVEDQLRKELVENEILLKEVHHRVKNNLTIISSLINLQRPEIESPEDAMEAIKRMMDRIQAIAMIHELLSSGPSLGEVNLSDYTRKLGIAMRGIYLGEKAVDLHLDIEEGIMVDMERAISFGLIYNEYLADAFLHGIQDREDPEVRVRLVMREEISLSVCDNGGEGYRDLNFSLQKGLEFRLVTLLSEQIKGRVRGILTDQGNEVYLHFPVHY